MERVVSTTTTTAQDHYRSCNTLANENKERLIEEEQGEKMSENEV